MIAEVSAALKTLFDPLLPAGVSVRFGPPVEPGAGLSVFLAAVQEDPHAAPADWTDVRDEQGRVVGRQPPVHRFDLHYLVSAWAKTAEAEDALLDLVLGAAVSTNRLDPALLGGALRGATEPVLVRLASDAATRWAGLGLAPHTVLGLTVNAPLVRPLETDLAPPADQITLGVDRRSGGPVNDPGARPRGRWRAAKVDEHPPTPAPAPRQRATPPAGPTNTAKERDAARGQAG